MLAAHLGDRAKRAKPVAAFGDLQEGEMTRSDAETRCIGKRMRGRGIEDHPLLFEPAEKAVRDLGHLLAAEDTHEVIDFGPGFEQRFALTFGETPGNDDAAN